MKSSTFCIQMAKQQAVILWLDISANCEQLICKNDILSTRYFNSYRIVQTLNYSLVCCGSKLKLLIFFSCHQILSLFYGYISIQNSKYFYFQVLFYGEIKIGTMEGAVLLTVISIGGFDE